MSEASKLTATSDQIVAQWQTIISTQMHFNDMILRTRSIGSSVVLAVYGYAAVALVQHPDKYLTIFGQPFHISVVVICFALLMLSSIFLMDFFYYYRLLLGMVDVGVKFEKNNSLLVDQTVQLGQKVSLRWANCVVGLFYFIPAAIGSGFICFVLTNYTQG